MFCHAEAAASFRAHLQPLPIPANPSYSQIKNPQLLPLWILEPNKSIWTLAHYRGGVARDPDPTSGTMVPLCSVSSNPMSHSNFAG